MQYFVTCVFFLDALDEDNYSQAYPDANLFKITRLKRIKIKKRRIQQRGHTQRQSADANSSHDASTNPPLETPTDTPSQGVNQTEPEARVPVTVSPVNSHHKKSYHSLPLNRTECLRRAARCFHEGLKLKENHYELAKKHFKTCEYIYSKLSMKGDVSVCNWILGELSFQNHYYSKAILFYKKVIKTYSEAKKLSDYQPPLSHIHDKVKQAIAQRSRYMTEGTAQDFSDHTTSTRQKLYHTGDLLDYEPQNQEEYHSHIPWQQPVLCEDASLGELICPQSQLLTVTQGEPPITCEDTSSAELVCHQSQLPWYRYLQEITNSTGDQDGLATEETHVLSTKVLEESAYACAAYELPPDIKLFILGNEKPTTSLVAS